MEELTNIEILETLSVNHKKLKEDKPFLFHKILKAMDKAKNQAINYTHCCESDSELLVWLQKSDLVTFPKDEINEVIDDYRFYQTNCG